MYNDFKPLIFKSGKQPAVVQSPPDDANFLLDPANLTEPPFLEGKYLPIWGALTGSIVSIFGNYNKRRPLYAGIHLTIGWALIGAGVGYLVKLKNDAYWADRDAILRHYVQLHPEDFPPKERILVGDMLKMWVPCR